MPFLIVFLFAFDSVKTRDRVLRARHAMCEGADCTPMAARAIAGSLWAARARRLLALGVIIFIQATHVLVYTVLRYCWCSICLHFKNRDEHGAR
jgi:hypothetical protein